MSHIFYYRIRFWDDADQKSENDDGFLAAETYDKAVERIAQYYDEDAIREIYIKCVDISTGGIVSTKVIQKNYGVGAS